MTRIAATHRRSRRIADLLVLLARGADEDVLSYLTEDAEWELAGFERRRGHAEFRALLSRVTDSSATTCTVTDILSHGDRCAAHGTFGRDDGSRTAFAHFFRFNGHGKNAKICKITTYTASSAVW